MQSLFAGDGGDVGKYVGSLISDAHFIMGLDDRGRVSSFMAFIVGYSAPSLLDPDEFIPADEIVFVPIVMCDSLDGQWTKKGFHQALSFYKILIEILKSPINANKFKIIGSMVESDGLNARMLDAIGFGKSAEYSNYPTHPYTTDFYALHI